MKQRKIIIDKSEDWDLKKVLIKVGEMLNELDDGKYEIVIRKPRRTSRQNRSLHLWFTWIAQALNESHNYFTQSFVKKFYKAELEIEWTGRMVKEYIWRPLQKAVTKKKSSTKLTTKEMSDLIEHLQKNIPDKLGIITEFPSFESAIRNIKPYEIIK